MIVAEPLTDTFTVILVAVTLVLSIVGGGGSVVAVEEVDALLPPAFTVRMYTVYSVFADKLEIVKGDPTLHPHHATLSNEYSLDNVCVPLAFVNETTREFAFGVMPVMAGGRAMVVPFVAADEAPSPPELTALK